MSMAFAPSYTLLRRDNATHGRHHIFDDVGAGQRAPQLRRKTEPAHCEDFIQSLEETPRF
jgi:hypothetical protein